MIPIQVLNFACSVSEDIDPESGEFHWVNILRHGQRDGLRAVEIVSDHDACGGAGRVIADSEDRGPGIQSGSDLDQDLGVGGFGSLVAGEAEAQVARVCGEDDLVGRRL